MDEWDLDMQLTTKTNRNAIRAMFGLICFMLGVIGIVMQIVLSEKNLLPQPSLLGIASSIIGGLGLVSLIYDCICIYKHGKNIHDESDCSPDDQTY